MEPSAVPEPWLQAEAQARALQRTFGQWPMDVVKGLPGLAIFQAICESRLPAPPFHEILNMLIVEVGPGRMVLQARPEPPHFNPLGSAHGGWIATLLDAAAGCAAHTLVPAGLACTTSNLNIHYVRGIGSHVPMVRAIGQVVHDGKTLATAQAQVVGPDGTLYAHATSTVVTLGRR